jgi:hypothetical protein
VEITETVISVPDQAANTQHVYVSDSQLSADGSQVTVTYSYKSDDSTTTGVGFSVGFDSSALTFNSATATAPEALVAGILKVDGSAVDFGFASLFGSFPGSNEVVLGTITFDIVEGATGQTQLETVGTSNTAGMDYDIPSQQIALISNSGDTSGATGSADVCTAPGDLSITQAAYVSNTEISGNQKIVTISYSSDDSTTTGLGLRIHFDSTEMTFVSSGDVLIQDNISAPSEVKFDTDDLDNDPETDSYVLASWASLFGSWPGKNEIDLMTLTFEVK